MVQQNVVAAQIDGLCQQKQAYQQPGCKYHPNKTRIVSVAGERKAQKLQVAFH
jgi:hypothetical protein